MTIAAGFVCKEGIVLGADSQETIRGFTKELSKGKVETGIYANFTIAFAGAGSSDYIRTAIQNVEWGISKCKNVRELQKQLRERLLDFFNEHLAPWAYFPEHERPTVELLIGTSFKDGPCGLFHYNGTSFHRILDHKAVGAGIIVANNLMSSYCWGVDKLNDLVPISIYIISQVKNSVDTCGGFTHLVVLREGADFALVNSNDIEKVETELENQEKENIDNFKKNISSKEMLKLSWLRRKGTTERGWG
jgi:hypothetical protein